MSLNMVKATLTVPVSLMQQFHSALIIPAIVGVVIAGILLVWQTILAAPALSFGGHGNVHFAETAVVAGSKPLLCFEAIEWKRLCPGYTYTRLSPINVSDKSAVPVDIEPHIISVPAM